MLGFARGRFRCDDVDAPLPCLVAGEAEADADADAPDHEVSIALALPFTPAPPFTFALATGPSGFEIVLEALLLSGRDGTNSGADACMVGGRAMRCDAMQRYAMSSQMRAGMPIAL